MLGPIGRHFGPLVQLGQYSIKGSFPKKLNLNVNFFQKEGKRRPHSSNFQNRIYSLNQQKLNFIDKHILKKSLCIKQIDI